MSKQVTKWEANDGKLFDSSELAESWDKHIKLEEYIDANPIYGQQAGCIIRAADLLDWANEHNIVIMHVPKAGKNGD